MTQEERELLLTDLSARLPYGVKIETPKGIGDLGTIKLTIFYHELGVNIKATERDYFPLDECKPYLRPMHSMTQKEFHEYNTFCAAPYLGINEQDASNLIDWLNRNMFDYRGLIEKGLVLDGSDIYNPPQEAYVPRFKVGELIKHNKYNKFVRIKKITDEGYEAFCDNFISFSEEDNWSVFSDSDWKPQSGDIFRQKETEAPIYQLCNIRDTSPFYFGFVQIMCNGIAGGEISTFCLVESYELLERHQTLEESLDELFAPLKEYLAKENNTLNIPQSIGQCSNEYTCIRTFMTDNEEIIFKGEKFSKQKLEEKGISDFEKSTYFTRVNIENEDK